jgi:hypothetical protein
MQLRIPTDAADVVNDQYARAPRFGSFNAQVESRKTRVHEPLTLN